MGSYGYSLPLFLFPENRNMARRKSFLSPACCPATALVASLKHVAAFKALAHAGRLKVFFYLVQVGKELPVNEIQSALRLPGPTLSHHLDSLEKAGLISRRKEEKFIFSIVRRDTVSDLVRLLTACC